MTNLEAGVTEFADIRRRGNRVVDFLRRLIIGKPIGAISAAVFLVAVFVALFADLVAPYDYAQVHPEEALAPPSAEFIFGTDHLGRDMLSRVIYGAQISMGVGVAATTLSIIVSLVIGVLSGYVGGVFDLVVQRFVDAWMCFPTIVVMITAASIFGPGLAQVIILLAFLWGIYNSRVVRGAVIAIKENTYVYASVAVGCTPARTIARHILPHILAPTVIIFTTAMPGIIIAEASLSFLGLGVPPPYPSWGGMLSGPARRFMLMAPWLAIWPGLALAVVVYSINMLGDAFRDLLDPRLKGGVGRYGAANREKILREINQEAHEAKIE
jgi:peptide/nickel transport system permease protein